MAKVSGYPAKILIVEDDPLTSELMKRIVEMEDQWKSTVVKCGKHAVAARDSEDFDVILMDLRMPGMNGIEATRKIRGNERRSGLKHTPIIAFTVMIGDENRRKCIEAGMDDFIEKPGSIQKVIDSIYKHLPDSPI